MSIIFSGKIVFICLLLAESQNNTNINSIVNNIKIIISTYKGNFIIFSNVLNCLLLL